MVNGPAAVGEGVGVREKPTVGQILLTFAPFLLAAGLALVQGGVLTDALFHSDPARTKGSITGFAWRWPPGFPSWWQRLVVIGAPGWEREVLKEFGLLLPLYLPALALLTLVTSIGVPRR